MGKKKNDGENNSMDSNSSGGDRDVLTIDTGAWNSDWPFKENDNVIDGLKLSWPTAERITIECLNAHLEMIYDRESNSKMFDEYYSEGDREQDRKVKKSIKRLLKYFGEDVE